MSYGKKCVLQDQGARPREQQNEHRIWTQYKMNECVFCASLIDFEIVTYFLGLNFPH